MKSALAVLGICCALTLAQDEKPSPIQSKPKRSAKPYLPPPSSGTEAPSPVPAPFQIPAPVPAAVKLPPAPAGAEEGEAVFHGRKGDTDMTALHRSFPKGTRVKVTNLATGKSVVLAITNRANPSGPVINVSRAAANQLDFVRLGRARVRVEAVN